jgi:hypothetical protein
MQLYYDISQAYKQLGNIEQYKKYMEKVKPKFYWSDRDEYKYFIESF